MKVLDGRNNIKVYNLSAGKSLPDWLTQRKKRRLVKRDVDIRHRIELIQDFNMPDVSNCVKVSADGQYILATGTYKPRVKCFDVSALSLKFEKGLDAEVIEFSILSEDYSKIVFLQDDRYIEFHNQGGRWFRNRIPKFGRDLAYHYPSCDLYIGTAGSEIYRLNLDQGKYMTGLQTDAPGINKLVFNPVHYLLTCGTEDGRVEAWDPRSRHRVGVLDCALHMIYEDIQLPIYKSAKELGVTALACDGGLTLAVGTQTGQVLLYDIRSDKPMLVKDHMDGFPIKDLEFHRTSNKVLSMSSNAVKIWEKDTGQAHTNIESDVTFNDLATIPGSGMVLMATEDVKMHIYFLPSLGPAPKWCGHLDSLIEELEEEETTPVYDDYKFVTENELKQLGLDNLIGSNVLRSVMHGYFIDVRLYDKAKLIANPTDYENAIKRKVKQKISEQNERKIVSDKLSKKAKFNKDSFARLREDAEGSGESQITATTILEDERFSSLFSKPEFTMNKESEIFGVTQPLVRMKDKSKLRQDESDDDDNDPASISKSIRESQNNYLEPDPSSDSDAFFSEESEREETPPIVPPKSKKNKKKKNVVTNSTFKFSTFTSADSIRELQEDKKHLSKMSLAKRLEDAESGDNLVIRETTSGNKEMDFSFGKSNKFEKTRQQQQDHHRERKELIRSTAKLKGKIKFNKPIF